MVQATPIATFICSFVLALIEIYPHSQPVESLRVRRNHLRNPRVVRPISRGKRSRIPYSSTANLESEGFWQQIHCSHSKQQELLSLSFSLCFDCLTTTPRHAITLYPDA